MTAKLAVKARAQRQLPRARSHLSWRHDMRKRTPWERFAEKFSLDPTTGCWVWHGAGASSPLGYGFFYDGVKTVNAHRWSYVNKYGPVPDGYHLDHFVCERPQCVNPDHVRPVTPRENTLRGRGPSAWNTAKTHCKNGHPLSGENLTFEKRDGSRVCRTCLRAADARHRAKKAAM